MSTNVQVSELDRLMCDMWNRHSIAPTCLIVAPKAERTLMRIIFPPLPIARTSKMRRLRKLKYRRRP
ncbi:hypothetical protein [Trinickia mobilis]|uniref:hypothetical protein n=1 Tax=Trinickia mobilis TaxID=2816356 RepID=UPI001A8EDC77|nr:hypothetical protein [Trinickia mobilis]